MKALPAAAILLGSLSMLMLLPPSKALAQSNRAIESHITHSQAQSSVDAKLEEHLARDWGLKAEEWTRYRQIMQGPLGVYSPNLDPLSALGIEARSDEERRRYAELQVQAEGRRVEKLLAYQRAYGDAWKRLYPTLSPVSPSAPGAPTRAPMNVTAGAQERLAVFIKDNCTACEQRVKQLQGSGRAFDLYMVGSRQDDTRIRQWAARVGIDAAKVRDRTVTLNHDAGRWLSIGGHGELPAVVREVGGRWQRE
jgi:integrating conjugative element protein (TIGR03759 family)